MTEKKEAVEHPAHYGGGDNPYEAIKVIEAWRLGFHLGNSVKYIARAPFKGTELEDLKKARWYLDRQILNLEKSHAETSQASKTDSEDLRVDGSREPRRRSGSRSGPGKGRMRGDLTVDLSTARTRHSGGHSDSSGR